MAITSSNRANQMCVFNQGRIKAMVTFLLIGSSLLFGYLGLNLDGAIGNGEGHFLAMVGFFLPSIFIIGRLYDKK